MKRLQLDWLKIAAASALCLAGSRAWGEDQLPRLANRGPSPTPAVRRPELALPDAAAPILAPAANARSAAPAAALPDLLPTPGLIEPPTQSPQPGSKLVWRKADAAPPRAAPPETAMTMRSIKPAENRQPAESRKPAENVKPTDALEPLPATAGAALDSATKETITEHYPEGPVKCTRQVVLDADMNYVNHGPYTEYDRAGKMLRTGNYVGGRQHGVWTRFFNADDGYLLTARDARAFGSSFVSRADFNDGKLDGMWTVTTRDGEKVLELRFHAGALHGKQTWWYPKGIKRLESSYDNGTPVGDYGEWDANGKSTVQLSVLDAHVLFKKVGWYANGRKHFEGWALSDEAIPSAEYDWWNGKVTFLTAPDTGPGQKHGTWTVWYPNGQTKTHGDFDRGVPTGLFTWWYENGQKQAEGEYVKGQCQGTWYAWHPNGQKASKTEYLAGEPTGKGFRWEADGRLAESYVYTPDGAKPSPDDAPVILASPNETIQR